MVFRRGTFWEGFWVAGWDGEAIQILGLSYQRFRNRQGKLLEEAGDEMAPSLLAQVEGFDGLFRPLLGRGSKLAGGGQPFGRSRPSPGPFPPGPAGP